jgi:hypothetical protein
LRWISVTMKFITALEPVSIAGGEGVRRDQRRLALQGEDHRPLCHTDCLTRAPPVCDGGCERGTGIVPCPRPCRGERVEAWVPLRAGQGGEAAQRPGTNTVRRIIRGVSRPIVRSQRCEREAAGSGRHPGQILILNSRSTGEAPCGN